MRQAIVRREVKSGLTSLAWPRRILLCCLVFYHTSAQQKEFWAIELVESVPIETTLDNPDIRDAHEVWLEMIRGAKKTLDIEQFYISNEPNEPLDDILSAIIAAGERGVRVRIIVDARMHNTYPWPADSLATLKDISLRIIDFGKLAGGIQHAKFFIVDGEEMFLGSQNFDWRALKHIHELGLRLKFPQLVRVYSDVFELDWRLAEQNDRASVSRLLKHNRYQIPFHLAVDSSDTLTMSPTFSPLSLISDTTLWDEKQIGRLLADAQEEILLQFLSYSPVGRNKSYYAMFETALRSAAARGVKVKMIVSDWAIETPEIYHLKSLSTIPNIEVRFTAIPEWSGGYIPFARVEHCKFIVVDGRRFWLGTSNGEKSYFYTSRNLGIIIENKRLSERLQQIFFKSWDSPYAQTVRPEKEYKAREHGERR
jgi:phosphatidylserine/phosphatidylglycerophosphate/cardiolipin synthase-like enzyme